MKNLESFGITQLSDKPITEGDLERIENNLNCRFPDSYRFFLKTYGESDFESWVVFPTAGGGVFPGTFMGLDILERVEDYRDRLPINCIPINEDGGDNLIIMSLDKSKFGYIYFQHHSAGIESNKVNNRWETLSLLATDFPSFIEGLQLDED